MCGIAGLWHRDGKPVDRVLLDRMTDSLEHRGPDDRGTYIDGSVGLGHRRLSIIDLSSAAHQPMSTVDGALWITYNGEIYNYIELREELQALGETFRSASDTEVLLKAYERWGANCVERFNGIWAFAIWDSRRQLLFCARDRFGVKPFHYAESGASFAFGSEIKAVLEAKLVPVEPNDDVIQRYLLLNITHADGQTFIRAVRELPAGHTLTVDRSSVTIRRYWDLPPYEQDANRSDAEWIHEYTELLDDAVRLQMRSDVPVGSCLSGGLDSTSITMLAAGKSSYPIDAFTAYLPHASYDERANVAQFTDRMGNAVQSHLVGPDMDTWCDELARVIFHHDEPHVGYTAPAQWEVMRLANSRGVKVLLDGQGADESLGGYNFFVESLVADYLRAGHPYRAWNIARSFEDRRGSGFVPGGLRAIRSGIRAMRPRDEIFRMEATVARRGVPLSDDWLDERGSVCVPSIERGNSRLESEIATALQVTMLPALLTYEDRASMAFSIESRVPYLDHRLVELAFRLPRHLRIDGTRTKVILRRIMDGRLPSEIVDAKQKKVFGTPYQLWFSKSLRDFALSILDDRPFRERPFVDRKKLDRWFGSWDGAANNRRAAYQVWNLVNLELWFRIVIERTLFVTPAERR